MKNEKNYSVEGMHCLHCAKRVTEALAEAGLKGKVDLEKKTVTVVSKDEISDQKVINALKEAGFGAKTE